MSFRSFLRSIDPSTSGAWRNLDPSRWSGVKQIGYAFDFSDPKNWARRFGRWLDPTTSGESPPDPGLPPPVDAGYLEAIAQAQKARRRPTSSAIRSTFLSGPRGDSASPTLGTPTLLGGGK